MIKVLICGATGFIGRNLTIHFSRYDEMDVHAVWHIKKPYNVDNVTWHQADLREAGLVDSLLSGFDLVIQAAATTSGAGDIISRPYIHTTDNAVMNSLLLRSAYDNEVKHFIFFSCTVMYPSSDLPAKEEQVIQESDINSKYYAAAWTKMYIEKMCKFFSELGRTRHTVIRHSNIYGPYDKFDLERAHVFGATVNKVLNAEKTITVWGKGKEKRDLLYINDLVEFVDLVREGQSENYELYNCGRGEAISVRDLVQAIIQGSKKKLEIVYDETKPNIAMDLHLDCKKAYVDFGWKPKTNIEEGIKKTLEWYGNR